jgi:hypothetical protein
MAHTLSSAEYGTAGFDVKIAGDREPRERLLPSEMTARECPCVDSSVEARGIFDGRRRGFLRDGNDGRAVEEAASEEKRSLGSVELARSRRV